MKHHYVVVYEINGEKKEFRVIAQNESEASDVCFYKICWGEEGEETYREIRIYEEPEEWINEDEYVGHNDLSKSQKGL